MTIASPALRPRTPLANTLALLGFIALCHTAGALGVLVTSGDWYRELARPGWAPPGWLFGPVWLTLYTMMAVAAWRAWRAPPTVARRSALRWFAIQLALNAAWSPVFFGLRSITGGLAVIVALLAAIVVTIVRMRALSSAAAWLLAPYLAWVGFATALNAAIWWLAL